MFFFLKINFTTLDFYKHNGKLFGIQENKLLVALLQVTLASTKTRNRNVHTGQFKDTITHSDISVNRWQE